MRRLLPLVVFLLTACGERAADTPQVAFERARACAGAGDWGGFYDLIAPGSRDLAIGSFLYAASFGRMGSDAAREEYRAPCVRHGLDPEPKLSAEELTRLTPQEQLDRRLAGVKDRRALFADLAAFVAKTMKPGQQVIDAGATPRPGQWCGRTGRRTR
jgi:hypothetical protein